MNKVCMVGRVTRDIDLKQATAGRNYANFTLAVKKAVSKGAVDPEAASADFIPCVAFDRKAEILSEYVHKGNQVGVIGKIQTSNYVNKEGSKVYKVEVIVEDLTLLAGKEETKNTSFQDYLPF